MVGPLACPSLNKSCVQMHAIVGGWHVLGRDDLDFLETLLAQSLAWALNVGSVGLLYVGQLCHKRCHHHRAL